MQNDDALASEAAVQNRMGLKVLMSGKYCLMTIRYNYHIVSTDQLLISYNFKKLWL
jgi:hypothetical protein